MVRKNLYGNANITQSKIIQQYDACMTYTVLTNFFLPNQLWQYTEIIRWHNTYSPYILTVCYESSLRKRG